MQLESQGAATIEDLDDLARNAVEIVAQNVRALMKENDFTQMDVAGRCGVSQKTVSNILNAAHSVQANNVARVAWALDVPAWSLYVPNAWNETMTGQQLVEACTTWLTLTSSGRTVIEAFLRHERLRRNDDCSKIMPT